MGVVKVRGNERILHRNGLQIETESLSECLRGFAAFLKSTVVKVRYVSSSKPVKTVLVGHNANVFDTPLLIRGINQIDLVRLQFQEFSGLTLRRQPNLGKASYQGKQPTSSIRRRYRSQGKPPRHLLMSFSK